jgi:hypothetical protein
MPSGGRRPGCGRPKGASTGLGKSESRKVLEARLRELKRRGTEDAKKEAVRVAVQLLPYDEPRLQAVTGEIKNVHYVARLPEPILDIDEWQAKMVPLLSQQ